MPFCVLRAGKNIESLAVGLNVDTAMFTITVAGTPEEAQQLLQRLDQLEKVALDFCTQMVAQLALIECNHCTDCCVACHPCV